MNINVRNYSFLSKVLTAYDEFNSNIDIYAEQNKYLSVCKLIMPRLSENEKNQENFCTKLIRNLGHYDVGTSFFDPSFDRCNILYNWIYNTIENSQIPNELINKCFEDYSDQINNMKRTPKCSYDLFISTYLEPRKITILKIFDDNIRHIIDKLNEEHSSTDSPSQKYVCECVKIYKEVEKDHCTNVIGTDNKHVKTCQMLKDFKTSYMQYIYYNRNKKYNVPSLENFEDEYKSICQKNQHISTLTATVIGNLDTSEMSEGINVENQENGYILELEGIEEKYTPTFMKKDLVNYYMMEWNIMILIRIV
ncbi:hypothetical protein PVNG_06266 [Plasmodium vivax North Korean]|uniref:Variable surface protein n=1 Tax=Plasmodium vivax North Korean TaxID=1035514 RepID=A0A0J9W6G0_PLAVI|nr:hypothetical protein PVNG_06266 [Plasmodium vivax North Korean]